MVPRIVGVNKGGVCSPGGMVGIAKRLEFSEFTHIERENNGSDPLAAESFPRAPGMAVPVSVSR